MRYWHLIYCINFQYNITIGSVGLAAVDLREALNECLLGSGRTARSQQDMANRQARWRASRAQVRDSPTQPFFSVS